MSDKFTLKDAAEKLLKVADQLEQEANEVTKFVCEGCNHTATLASINEKRAESAKVAGENVVVSDVTVNDKIHCPACDDVMAYSQTEESKQFYFDPDKVAAEEEEEEKKEKKEKKEEKEPEEKEEKEEKEPEEKEEKTASIDYDSVQRYASK